MKAMYLGGVYIAVLFRVYLFRAGYVKGGEMLC
jgi:hypothetical protein